MRFAAIFRHCCGWSVRTTTSEIRKENRMTSQVERTAMLLSEPMAMEVGCQREESRWPRNSAYCWTIKFIDWQYSRWAFAFSQASLRRRFFLFHVCWCWSPFLLAFFASMQSRMHFGCSSFYWLRLNFSSFAGISVMTLLLLFILSYSNYLSKLLMAVLCCIPVPRFAESVSKSSRNIFASVLKQIFGSLLHFYISAFVQYTWNLRTWIHYRHFSFQL